MEFSVIITTDYSEEGIDETVESIISQSLDFEKNTEIIIVDSCAKNKIKNICSAYSEKYPLNVRYIKNDTSELSRNLALKHAKGLYITFLNCGDVFAQNTFKAVSDFFKKNSESDIVSNPIYFVNELNPNHKSNRRFDKSKVSDLIKNPEDYQLFGPSSFIRRESVKDIRFLDVNRNCSVLINEILIKNPKLGLCKEGRCDAKIILDKNPQLKDIQTTKEYYTNVYKNCFSHLISLSFDKYGEVIPFIKNALMYDFAIMLHAEGSEEIFTEKEADDFKKCLKEVLSHIDEEIILNQPILNDYQKLNALFLKYGEINDEIISKFDFDTVFIDTYDIVNDKLSVLANITNIKQRDVDVFVNGEKIQTKKIRFPQRDKHYFNYTYGRDYSFEFEIGLSDEKTYLIEFKSDNKQLEIDFSRPCNFSRVAGYAKTRKYMSVLKDDNKILISKKTSFKWIRQEVKTIIKMLKEREAGYKVGVPSRIAYMLGYPFLKNKHIWFFMDRPESAEDNGRHMFEYCIDKDPNIKKYFIIDKNSEDYCDMKKIGKVLGYKSLKHRYLGLFVENIITSHPDNGIIYPFWGTYPHLAGLLKSNNDFLQHGIIKDDISSWLNKFSMNLSLFVTSTPQEYSSVFENPYHYEESVVKLLGLPRYDKLKNVESKKQIIILPSWRRHLTNKSKKFIKQSDYFKRFNSLINNERLIEKAKEYNYEIIYRLHPKFYEFSDLFSRNDYVEIDSGDTSFQTLFNNGSVLITDYSSVAFDFSYLKKPILYYQYYDDYHFDVESGYFKYESMGFGEVCKEEDELVDLIIEYMENDCKMKKKYASRVENFFLYHDKNNCKRVYDAIKEIPLKD